MDSRDTIYELTDKLDPKNLIRFCEVLQGRKTDECDEQFWRHQLRKHYGGLTLNDLVFREIATKNGKTVDINTNKKLFEVLSNIDRFPQYNDRTVILKLQVKYPGIDIGYMRELTEMIAKSERIRAVTVRAKYYKMNDLVDDLLHELILITTENVFFLVTPRGGYLYTFFWNDRISITQRTQSEIIGSLRTKDFVLSVLDRIRESGTKSWWKLNRPNLPSKYQHLVNLMTGEATDKRQITAEYFKFINELDELTKFVPELTLSDFVYEVEGERGVMTWWKNMFELYRHRSLKDKSDLIESAYTNLRNLLKEHRDNKTLKQLLMDIDTLSSNMFGHPKMNFTKFDRVIDSDSDSDSDAGPNLDAPIIDYESGLDSDSDYDSDLSATHSAEYLGSDTESDD